MLVLQCLLADGDIIIIVVVPVVFGMVVKGLAFLVKQTYI